MGGELGGPGGEAPWFRPQRPRGGSGGLAPRFRPPRTRGGPGGLPPGLGHSAWLGINSFCDRFS